MAAAVSTQLTEIFYQLPPPPIELKKNETLTCCYRTMAWLVSPHQKAEETRRFAAEWFNAASASHQSDWMGIWLERAPHTQSLLRRLNFPSPFEHHRRPHHQVRCELRDELAATLRKNSENAIRTCEKLSSQKAEQQRIEAANQALLENLQPFCDKLQRGQSKPPLHALQELVANECVLPDALAQAHGLVCVDWTPNAPFSQLLQSLKTRGPIVIFGEFGETYREQPSKQLPYDVFGRKMWGWGKQSDVAAQPPGSTQQGPPYLAHVITVIGATTITINSRKVETVVYQDVDHPDKFYATSYPAFTKKVVASTCMRSKNPRVMKFLTFGFQDPASH